MAFFTLSGINYKKNENICLFNNCDRYINIYRNIIIHNDELLDKNQKIIKVYITFRRCCIYRINCYNNPNEKLYLKKGMKVEHYHFVLIINFK